ncbi:LPXTG cell wall anchor domain-containing protein [Bacillus sp. DNRA2]|uniref:Ig-like domain-containing protein n=1 Tax=Bacillus sp. DNRA2 TaxID=2723053 RepID=UPI00145D3CF1|nr:Ig-like domain-containing protein [Bacillus sp. DNRA2]NMD68668.1 LPXTG cell wall anchor domain-containing protein [Bacillus sp. DNRA2]
MKMNKFLLNGLSIGVLTLVLLFSTVFVSYAAGGSGSGSGGGTDPVTFVGAYLTSISENVSTTGEDVKDSNNIGANPTIKLVFNKNVVNSTVWGTNSQAISLADANNNAVLVDVFRIPDEGDGANPDEKRNIFVKPTQALTAGATYTLTIKASLAANNTSTLGKKETVTFTVKEDTVAPELTVTAPQNNSISTKKKVTVTGTTEAGSIVKVNDTVVPVIDAGVFSYEVTLNNGANQITISSTDAAGNEAKTVWTVTYDSSSAGGGSGSGGGSEEPLALLTSTIQNGTTGVSVRPQIKLTFNKNIVNSAVSENNKGSFSLLSATGTIIPIDIIFADDATEPDKRNDAIIIPKSDLDFNTAYTLIISSDLTSKSGVKTGQETKIAFTTEAAKAATTPVQAVGGSGAATVSQPSGTELPNTATNYYTTAMLGSLMVALGGITYFIRRRKTA